MKHENISELAPTIEDNNYPSVFMIYVNRGEKLSIKCNICWGHGLKYRRHKYVQLILI